jgi:phenylpyruvate tautomerase PptA (4-oxalocrotonate tautomerase family)
MPYLQLDAPFAVPDRAALAGELIDVYVRSMESEAERVSVAFREVADVLRRVDGELVPAVVLSCDIRRGRPPDVCAAFIAEATALLARRLDVAPERVAIYLTEHAAVEIARGGRVTSDWSPR